MQNPTSNKKESGFGLIEVMVSIVILTFGLLALGPLATLVVTNNVLSSRITLATTFGQSQMESYRRMPFNQIPAIGTTLRTWIDPATMTEYTSTTSTPPSGCPTSALRRVTSILGVGSPAAANMRLIQVVVWWDNNRHNVILQTIISQ